MNSSSVPPTAAAADGTALPVSVALCTHNGARFLAEQVQSICTQTSACQQLVLSDDASTDAGPDIVQHTVAAAGARAPVLDLIVNRTPLQVTKNFEQAVLRCNGELIALCDQDDRWHPEYIENMRAQFAQRPELLLLHADARRIDARGRLLPGSLFETKGFGVPELARFGSGQALEVLVRRNIVTGAVTVFRRRLLCHAAPFPLEWLHDEWLAVVAAAVGETDVLRMQLVDYRQHGDNQVGAMPTSLGWKLRKAFGPRDPRLQARIRKVEVLLDRLEQLGPIVAPAKLALVRGKLAHQRFRAALPPSRLARWPLILREVARGRYDRFGVGLHNLARDLFESAR